MCAVVKCKVKSKYLVLTMLTSTYPLLCTVNHLYVECAMLICRYHVARAVVCPYNGNVYLAHMICYVASADVGGGKVRIQTVGLPTSMVCMQDVEIGSYLDFT